MTDIRPESLEYWGDWDGGYHCPNNNELATGFRFGWEPVQGDGDDTGGNGFWVHCNGIDQDPTGRENVIGRSGDWSKRTLTDSCRKGHYLYAIQVWLRTRL